jgi:hypothetical protein
MKIKNWTACVQDRGKWKEVVERAKTFNWEVQRLEEEDNIIIQYLFFFRRDSPPVGQGLLIHEVSRSHNDAPQSVGLLWPSDQLVAETFT